MEIKKSDLINGFLKKEIPIGESFNVGKHLGTIKVDGDLIVKDIFILDKTNLEVKGKIITENIYSEGSIKANFIETTSCGISIEGDLNVKRKLISKLGINCDGNISAGDIVSKNMIVCKKDIVSKKDIIAEWEIIGRNIIAKNRISGFNISTKGGKIKGGHLYVYQTISSSGGCEISHHNIMKKRRK